MKILKNNQPKRRMGILAAVFSLPGSFGIGGFGSEMLRFLDKISECGIRTLSLLPLNPTSFGNSPYQSPSACAGNIYFISPEILYEDGLLSQKDLEEAQCPNTGIIDYGRLFETRPTLLKKAFQTFCKRGGLFSEGYQRFCKIHSDWLDEYAAFMTIKEAENYQPFWMWSEELRQRQEPFYSRWMKEHEESHTFYKFTQFLFFSQWARIKRYASEKSIEVIGDMPFYVAADSADVWSRPELFMVNPSSGQVELWSGVPSDDFSSSDRNWGNPVYRWENHKADNYAWFRQRIRVCAEMYDGLRIDHVIAMMRYFGIKNGTLSGSWYDGPEMEDHRFSEAVCQEAKAGGLYIIAEDLGMIPDGLRERMCELHWSGMRVLQFAFTEKYNAKSNHLPFYHHLDMVVYTGTHDNPTLREFLMQKSSKELQYMRWWLRKGTHEDLHWPLIEEACKSPANWAIFPMQDLLGLGDESRMVYSDDCERSWKWRLPSLDAFDSSLCRRLKCLAVLTGRYGVADEQEFSRCLDR